jgi:hypothetical protein
VQIITDSIAEVEDEKEKRMHFLNKPLEWDYLEKADVNKTNNRQFAELMGRIHTEGMKELKRHPELKSEVLGNTKIYNRSTMNPQDREVYYDDKGNELPWFLENLRRIKE